MSQRGKKITQVAKISAAGFSAALAADFDASDLSAGIISLDFNPTSVAYSAFGTLVPVDITRGSVDDPNDAIAFFEQVNTASSKGFGLVQKGGITSWRKASENEELNISTFSGVNEGLANSPSAEGDVFVAFKADGNLGWFEVDLGGLGGAVSYTAGQYGTAGESLIVGGGSGSGGGSGVVPEPGHVGLSLLALGAVGVRRRRAMKKANG